MIRCALACLLLIALLAPILPAYAGWVETRDGKDYIHLKVFSLPDPNNTFVMNRIDLAVLREFRKKYPYIIPEKGTGLTLEKVAFDAGPLMAIAGGVSPDVIYVNFRQSDTYIQEGFLHPLTEYVTQMKREDMEEYEMRVPKAVEPVIYRKGPEGTDEYWAMPYNTFVMALYYRKDLFAEAGLDPDRPPETWDELMEYCKRLTDPTKKRYGLLLGGSGGSISWRFMSFLWSAGGEAVMQDENGEWRAAFDTPEAAEAAWFYKELLTQKWRAADGKIYEGYCTPDSNAWGEGRCAMNFGYLDDKTIARGSNPDLIGIAPVPKGPTGIRGSEINCTMMGIFSGVKDPRIRDAAWKYIRFMDNMEAKKIRVRSMIDEGMGRMVNPILLERFGYQEYLDKVPANWLPVFKETLLNGHPEPYGKNCQFVYHYLTQPLDEIVQMQLSGQFEEKSKAQQLEIIQERMTHYAGVTDEKMIGIIAPDVMSRRKLAAGVFVSIVGIAFLFILRYVWRIFTPEESVGKGWQFKKYWPAYCLLVPAVLSILVWRYIPLLQGSMIAFQDYSVVKDSEFTGLTNFANILFDKSWWMAMWRTLHYMGLMVVLGFFPPIILAILLQEVSKGKVIYRTLYYLPAVMTGVVVLFLWKMMYDKSPEGLLNQVIGFLGIKPQRWIEDTRLAMLCCVLPTVWAGMGPGCLIYLAALKGIPNEMYEAADIDGASFVGKVQHIVVPSLKGIIMIQFINFFIMAAQNSGYILIMTFGGPAEATNVAGFEIFKQAYVYLKFGTATAMSWTLASMLLGFTVIQMRKLSRMEFRAAASKEAQ